MLSGDIELNPGPDPNNRSSNVSETCYGDPATDYLFQYRLLTYGLRSLDVGGGGDCFFRSVSHQLYGDKISER